MARALSYDFSRLAILVLEESALMRELVRDILREFNIREVTEVARPDAAWALLETRAFDLVLIDWSPECDGLTLLKRIRQDKKSPAPMIPVIVMSAFTEMGEVAAARDAGANAFLAKPVSARDLYDHLVAVVEANRAFVRVTHYAGPDRRRDRKNPKTPYAGPERRHPHESPSPQGGEPPPGVPPAPAN